MANTIRRIERPSGSEAVEPNHAEGVEDDGDVEDE